MSPSSTLPLITLPEVDKLRGHENYPAWRTLMEIHGKPKGLLKYWKNKINIPIGAELPSDSEGEEEDGETESSPATPSIVITPATDTEPKPTPLHSTTPSVLEYELRESVALSSILANIADITGSGINSHGTSHAAWALLKDQYGRTTDRARNMREDALAACRLEDGGKVAGEDGHIERMRTLCKRANDAGAGINDARFITKLLDSFPESWDPVVTPMYSEESLSTVIMNLTAHAEKLTMRESKSKKTPPAADAVRALEATVLALQARQ